VPTNGASFTASYVRPLLSLQESGSSLVLSWPGWAGTMSLYSATNLSPPVDWTIMTNAPTASNSVLTLSVPSADGNRFFRLQTP
jgi:hypothetical protein